MSSHASQQASRLPSRRRGATRTFSGCATCRKRKVRCDETLPSCRRCVRSKLGCTGYPGYRSKVFWKPIRSPSNFAEVSKEQTLHRTLPSTSDLTTKGVPRDKASFVHERPDSSIVACPSDHDLSPVYASDLGIDSSDAALGYTVERKSTSENSISSNSSIRFSSSGRVGDSIAVQRQDTSICPSSEPAYPLQYYDTDDNDITAHRDANHLSASWRAENDTPDCLSSHFTAGHYHSTSSAPDCTPQSLPSAGPTHLDRLSEIYHQRRLMQHWVSYLSDALMPIPGAQNPMKKILVAIAYEGALSCAQNSNASVALFHLICASAAFNLSSQITSSSDRLKFRGLGLDHHCQGLFHLQQNIVKEDANVEPILSSLLVCLMYEPDTVDSSYWRNHLHGALEWLHKAGINAVTKTKSSTTLYQMLMGTAILLRSQLMPNDILQKYYLPSDIDSISDPYVLYEIWGLPLSVLRSLDHLIALTSRAFRTQDGECLVDPTSSFQLDRVELEMYLAMPKMLQHDRPEPSARLGYHYSCTFYYASLIYLKRVVRRSPIKEVQSLVEQSLDHIGCLGGCTSRPFCPLVWPILITCFEANTAGSQKRGTASLDLLAEWSTLLIWQRAKLWINRIWSWRTTSNNEDLQWLDVPDDPSTPRTMMV